MLLSTMMALFLLASSVATAPTNSSSATEHPRVGDDDPLEVSETGHSRRRRLWRRLLKQVSGMGLGGYGLGLGGSGLNFLSHMAHLQNHGHFAHAHSHPHRGPTEYAGVGGGVGSHGSHASHYPAYPVDGASHGGNYGGPANYPVHHGHGDGSPAGLGPWDTGAWGLIGNYGLGDLDGLHYETVWL